jgi:nucleoside-diphosphate-sugar epimerase
MRILMLGCGYLGEPLAMRLHRAGHQVTAASRRPQRVEQLRKQGLNSWLCDWSSETAPPPPGRDYDAVVIAIGHRPPEGIPPALGHVQGLERLSHWLAPAGPAASQGCRWLYVSSTGLYQPADGDWVDESWSVVATRPSTASALAAEQWLSQQVPAPNLLIARLAGIYGPGRLPNRQPLIDQQPLPVDPQAYVNLIHVEDAGRILAAWLTTPQPPTGILNICDGQPPCRKDYYLLLSQLLRLPPPRFASPDAVAGSMASAAAVSGGRRGEGNKRVSNRRLNAWLSDDWLYPSYRQGLPASLHQELTSS